MLQQAMFGPPMQSKRMPGSKKDRRGEEPFTADSLAELEENLDEELAVEYYVLKHRILAGYAASLVFLRAVRQVLTESERFGNVSRKELGTMIGPLKKGACAADGDNHAAQTATALLREVEGAFSTVAAREENRGSGEGMWIGRRHHPDPEVVTAVWERLAREEHVAAGVGAGVAPGWLKLPDGHGALLAMTMFWAMEAPTSACSDAADPLHWLGKDRRTSIFERAKLAAAPKEEGEES